MMRWLLLIHTAPASMPSLAALQLVQSALADGTEVTVFFHADGVYHALPVAATDPGTTALHDSYCACADHHAAAANSLRLLVCRASLSRRSSRSTQMPWHDSGMIELADLLQHADRVISFVD